jgi:ComF family protein
MGHWFAWLDLLLPARCAGCGRAGDSLPLCERCAVLSGNPLADRAPPAPLRGWSAAARYETGGGEEWVRRFKYPRPGLRGLDPAAEAVAAAWIRSAAAGVPGPAPERVVPIPLHPRRLRERGFSPPAVLARDVARSSGSRVAPRALVRVRDTPSQTGLSRRARQQNVAGAFRAVGASPQRVWLVDDVVTTGSTLVSAARALHRAGAREVWAVCLAWRPETDGAGPR